MEKRRYDRVKVGNCLADLSDGKGFFSGVIGDVSRQGLLLQEIPKRFDSGTRKLIVVFAVERRNFKIVGAPRWVEDEGMARKMGVEILKAPTGWAEFVAQQEPKASGHDAWTGVSLRN